MPERVAENVYIFSSETYAQLNAGAVVGPEWSVIIDTLIYPEETKGIRDFVEGRLGSPVRYLINTHYHFDHTLGNCWFPNATILSTKLCRELLDTRGRKALEISKEQNKELRDVKIVLPNVVFEEGSISIRVGKQTLTTIMLPGHSPDGIGVLIEEDRVLFAGDAMMAVPTIFDGDIEQLEESLKRIPALKPENVVQGHGDVILRGEVGRVVDDDIRYLAYIKRHAKKALRRRDPEGYLASLDIEETGMSRILLNGSAPELHKRNLLTQYHKLKAEQ